MDIFSLSLAAALHKTGALVTVLGLADSDEVASPIATAREMAELEVTAGTVELQSTKAFPVAWILVVKVEAAVTEGSGIETTDAESVVKILESPF
jgi:hypothetical protein